MFRLLRNNIPIDFFPKETRLDVCRLAYRPQQGTMLEDAWMQAVMLEMLASAPEMVVSSHTGNDARISTAASHWLSVVSHQLQLWPISINLRPLKASACMSNTTNLCCFQACLRYLLISTVYLIRSITSWHVSPSIKITSNAGGFVYISLYLYKCCVFTLQDVAIQGCQFKGQIVW